VVKSKVFLLEEETLKFIKRIQEASQPKESKVATPNPSVMKGNKASSDMESENDMGTPSSMQADVVTCTLYPDIHIYIISYMKIHN